MRILFIDDEPIRARKLMKAGHDVYVTHHPDAVELYLATKTFDLVCCDHDMPIVDGMVIVNDFLIERGVPVVVHSTNSAAAARMVAKLEEYAVPVLRHDITTQGYEDAVVEFVNDSYIMKGN